MRKFIAYISITGIFVLIVALFWNQEVQYWLPTPVPEDYTPVEQGSTVRLDFLKKNNKPHVLHFYNPNCPCSKFNMQSFETLLKKHHQQFNFNIIVQESAEDISEHLQDLFKKYDAQLITDTHKKIAIACGVYATPQLVLLNKDQKLYYKGNYNKARYCTSSESDFGAMAIDSILLAVEAPQFPALSQQAYGCSLNKRTQ